MPSCRVLAPVRLNVAFPVKDLITRFQVFPGMIVPRDPALIAPEPVADPMVTVPEVARNPSAVALILNAPVASLIAMVRAAVTGWIVMGPLVVCTAAPMETASAVIEIAPAPATVREAPAEVVNDEVEVTLKADSVVLPPTAPPKVTVPVPAPTVSPCAPAPVPSTVPVKLTLPLFVPKVAAVPRVTLPV